MYQSLSDFGSAVKSGFRQYFNFSGRATPSEFWYFILFFFAAYLVVWVIDHLFLPPILTLGDLPGGTLLPGGYIDEQVGLAVLAYRPLMAIPTLAVTVRRLHDVGKNNLLQFGRMIGLDFITNNFDRFPVVWDNTGNPGNVMFYGNVEEDGVVTELANRIVAIDNMTSCISKTKFKKEYDKTRPDRPKIVVLQEPPDIEAPTTPTDDWTSEKPEGPTLPEKDLIDIDDRTDDPEGTPGGGGGAGDIDFDIPEDPTAKDFPGGDDDDGGG